MVAANFGSDQQGLMNQSQVLLQAAGINSANRRANLAAHTQTFNNAMGQASAMIRQQVGQQHDLDRLGLASQLATQERRDQFAIDRGFGSYAELEEAAQAGGIDMPTLINNLDTQRLGAINAQKLQDEIASRQQLFPVELSQDVIRAEQDAAYQQLQAGLQRKAHLMSPESQGQLRALMNDRNKFLANPETWALPPEQVANKLRSNMARMAEIANTAPEPPPDPFSVITDPTASPEQVQQAMGAIVRPFNDGSGRSLVYKGSRNGMPNFEIAEPSKDEFDPDRQLFEIMNTQDPRAADAAIERVGSVFDRLRRKGITKWGSISLDDPIGAGKAAKAKAPKPFEPKLEYTVKESQGAGNMAKDVERPATPAELKAQIDSQFEAYQHMQQLLKPAAERYREKLREVAMRGYMTPRDQQDLANLKAEAEADGGD